MRLLIKKRSEFPACVRDFNELKGICVGDCIIPYDPPFVPNEEAHAHPYSDDPKQGWICIKHKYLLHDKHTLLHEVGHLLANTDWTTPWHGKEWRRAIKQIGGTYKPYTWRYNGRTISYPVDLSHADPVRVKH